MRLRALTLAALFPLATFGAIAATPDNGTDCRDFDGTSQICRTQVYLECGTTTVPFVNQALLDGTPQWGYDAPAGSITGGDGCGEYDDSALRGTTQETVWSWDIAGNVRGDLDEMTVDLYNLDLGNGRAGGPINLDVRISVDGKSPFGSESIEGATGEVFQSPAVMTIPVTPVDMGAVTLYRFTVTGLAESISTISPDSDDKNRFVQITIDVPGTTNYAGFNPWIWGAADAPTGVTFNGLEDEDKGTVVEALVG